MAPKKHPKKHKNKGLSPDERKKRKIKSAHIRSVRAVFRNIGFERVGELAGVEVVVGHQAGEFDDAFMYENLILIVEHTTSQSSDVTDHIKKKSIIFSNIMSNPKKFLLYFREKSPLFNSRLSSKFHVDQYILKIVYCSLYAFDESIKDIVTDPIYLDYPVVKYFERLSTSIKMSCLNELLAFLNVEPSDVAKNGIFPSQSQSDSYDGSILPEWSSGFPEG